MRTKLDIVNELKRKLEDLKATRMIYSGADLPLFLTKTANNFDIQANIPAFVPGVTSRIFKYVEFIPDDPSLETVAFIRTHWQMTNSNCTQRPDFTLLYPSASGTSRYCDILRDSSINNNFKWALRFAGQGSEVMYAKIMVMATQSGTLVFS